MKYKKKRLNKTFKQMTEPQLVSTIQAMIKSVNGVSTGRSCSCSSTSVSCTGGSCRTRDCDACTAVGLNRAADQGTPEEKAQGGIKALTGIHSNMVHFVAAVKHIVSMYGWSITFKAPGCAAYMDLNSTERVITIGYQNAKSIKELEKCLLFLKRSVTDYGARSRRAEQRKKVAEIKSAQKAKESAPVQAA